MGGGYIICDCDDVVVVGVTVVEVTLVVGVKQLTAAADVRIGDGTFDDVGSIPL